MKTIRTVHERKQLRLRDFDYSRDGSYYITLCVHDRIKCFGEVVNGEMKLSECGNIVDRQFKWLQNQYPYISIPAWIVMPDHVHAMIEINRALINNDGDIERPHAVRDASDRPQRYIK